MAINLHLNYWQGLLIMYSTYLELYSWSYDMGFRGNLDTFYSQGTLFSNTMNVDHTTNLDKM